MSSQHSPVPPDLAADPHHPLDLRVPPLETLLGVIMLVASDGDVSEAEIAHLKLMHLPVVQCCLSFRFTV